MYVYVTDNWIFNCEKYNVLYYFFLCIYIYVQIEFNSRPIHYKLKNLIVLL